MITSHFWLRTVLPLEVSHDVIAPKLFRKTVESAPVMVAPLILAVHH